VLAANVMLPGRQCQPRDAGSGNFAAQFAHLMNWKYYF
jgi:hypothetical protein